MKSIMLLLITLLLWGGTLMADINNYYDFEYSEQAYVPITGAMIPHVVGDDNLSNPVGISFPFHYGANIYTSVRVSSNGYITLDPLTDDETFNDLAASLYTPILAILWDDTRLMTSAPIAYTGTAPERVCTIQYTGMRWAYYITNSFDFQVKIYETGQVDFCYGPSTGTPSAAHASIGLNMLPGGTGNFLSVTPHAGFAVVSSTECDRFVIDYPGEGTVYSFVPVSPPAHDLAGMTLTGPTAPILNQANSYTLVVNNRGIVQETNYTVNLMEGNTVLATQSGPAIPSLETVSINLSWTPATPGSHILYGKVNNYIDEIHENDGTDSLYVAVVAEPTTTVTIGDGSTFSLLPMDLYSFTSISETLYLADELEHFGTISALAYYNNYWSDVQNNHVMVWMGTTNLDELPATWIPSTELTLVFDGLMNFPVGHNVICIPLDTPFSYTEQNLVVMFYRPWCETYYTMYEEYQSQMGTFPRSLLDFSGTTEIDPAAPPQNYQPSMVIPRTTFYFETVGNDPNELPVISSALLQNYPNPFNPATTIPYDIKSNQPITISIYNIKGQLVRTLVNETKSTGHYTTIWNGKDNHRKAVSPGVYTYRLQGKGYSYTRKMLLMK